MGLSRPLPLLLLVAITRCGAQLLRTFRRTAASPRCPGTVRGQGIGVVSLVPNGWTSNDTSLAEQVAVDDGRIRISTNGRAYFASSCTAGTYDNLKYVALDLRNRTMRYTTDISSVGCGCNAALYLTNLHQNWRKGSCGDYYCDANDVCGVSCAEIDIQEGNLYAWHTTFHSQHDHAGVAAGYGGGGKTWNGPRSFKSADYGPDSKCINTKRPFEVAVSFPVHANGSLKAMKVLLSQRPIEANHTCHVNVNLTKYHDMRAMDEALSQGMTPIVSYWHSNEMLWMDGVGEDDKGPCKADTPRACGESVLFYGFSINPPMPFQFVGPQPTMAPKGNSTDTRWHVESLQRGTDTLTTWEYVLIGACAVLTVEAAVLLLFWLCSRRGQGPNTCSIDLDGGSGSEPSRQSAIPFYLPLPPFTTKG